MKVGIIGTGLIGGSMALALRSAGFASSFAGVERSDAHAVRALELGLVDEMLPLERAAEECGLLILSTPVDAAEALLPRILDRIGKGVVIDTGSIKARLLQAVRLHPARGRYVATHPMWGTEYSGPDAAVEGAFRGRATVICDREGSDADALSLAEEVYRCLGMQTVYMNGTEHDVHVAYVSHISHITSFALANTVLEKEREEDAIFTLASGGFESTVRLAKSNPGMWVPIFMQNRENVLDVLNEHIAQLRKFKACLEKENEPYLRELIEGANRIRKIIK